MLMFWIVHNTIVFEVVVDVNFGLVNDDVFYKHIILWSIFLYKTFPVFRQLCFVCKTFIFTFKTYD